MRSSNNTKRFAAMAAFLALPAVLGPARQALAQTPIFAPAGWKSAARPNGVRVFTPPDLAPGEVYSVTVYDSAPLGSKTPEAYLRAFAGPVGDKPGQLQAPLEIQNREGRVVTGMGAYAGPNNTSLGVLFLGVLANGGKTVHISRTLYSEKDELVARYQNQTQSVLSALVERAKQEPQSGNAAPPPAEPASNIAQNAKAATQKTAPDTEERYQWVTQPGKGVPDAQIEAVVQHYDEWLSVGWRGLLDHNVKDDVYLLLKNGRIHKGLRVPPDQLDVSRSRQNEPQTWGRWRPLAGKYEVSWSGEAWKPLPGQKVRPGKPQTRLHGHYGTGTSRSSALGGSYALWGVAFSKNGRFKKDRRGGSSVSVGTGESATNVHTGYDDEGSFSSASGSNFAVGSNKKANPNGDHEGAYAINGYTLTLRYDNGRVARLPFFFRDAERSSLWFEGATLTGGGSDTPNTKK